MALAQRRILFLKDAVARLSTLRLPGRTSSALFPAGPIIRRAGLTQNTRPRFELQKRADVMASLLFVLTFASCLVAQSQVPTSPEATDDSDNKDRILGVIPNYLTVEDSTKAVAPLTVKQKFRLFAKETFDPFTAGAAAAGAALSQISNNNPKYGQGAGAYGERFGAAAADITTQNLFSDAVLASVLHEDPRYFRKGPEFGLWNRVGYALSRAVITRTDAGHERFNYSGTIGMGMGIALSNAYYPRSSVTGGEVGRRFESSLLATALSNLLPEFWPDIHEKLFRHKPRHVPPSADPRIR
jgi:hypothetical protein